MISGENCVADTLSTTFSHQHGNMFGEIFETSSKEVLQNQNSAKSN
jgi:hypothetical protein